MDRKTCTMLFVGAGIFNSGILLFSKGLSDNLGEVDPLFNFGGCIGILLWGLAYASTAMSHEQTPATSLVFALEKLFYGAHWLLWLSAEGGKLPAMLKADPLTGAFFCLYGAGDLAFMAFFAYVAWKWRRNFTAKVKV